MNTETAPEADTPEGAASALNDGLGGETESRYLASEQRPRDGGPRFRVSDGGRTISDEDFIFDAMIRIGGDFGGDALRTWYAQWICDSLNEADKQLPREPHGAPNVDVTGPRLRGSGGQQG